MKILKKHIFAYIALSLFVVLIAGVTFSFGRQNKSAVKDTVERQTMDTAQGDTENFWNETNTAANFLLPLENIEEEKVSEDKPLTPQEILVERMAEGLTKYFTKRDGMADCGMIYRTHAEIKVRSLFYAYTVVLAAEEHSEEDYALNPWGLLGVFLHESGLDPCACGKNPRETAYRLKLLKKPRIGLTHKKEILIEALKNHKMKRAYASTGYDLGLGQMLQPNYSKPTDFDLIFSPVYAANQAAKEMVRRGRARKTDRPWEYWRRSRHSEKYARRIRIKARLAGALKGEI